MDIRNRVNIENVILGEGGERTVNGESETPVGPQIGSGSWLDEFKVFVATDIRNDCKNWSGATGRTDTCRVCHVRSALEHQLQPAVMT